MGLNFRKSIKLTKGVRLNLSKSGVGISFGGKGVRQSVSTSGRATTTIGIPGTGVYYTKRTNVKKLGSKLFGSDAGKSSKSDKSGKKAAAVAVPDNSENERAVAEYEAHIEAIKSIHKNQYSGVPRKVAFDDIDGYLEVLNDTKPFDDILDFGSEFEVGTDIPGKLEVEFKVMSEEVVPKVSLSLTSTGKLSEKAMAKSAYYDLVQDYVCSTILRVARDCFTILPIDTIVIHAVDVALNPATGFDEEVTLVSSKIKRDQIAAVNLDRVDPSDAIQSFGCNMKFSKTTGFKPVNRVSL